MNCNKIYRWLKEAFTFKLRSEIVGKGPSPEEVAYNHRIDLREERRIRREQLMAETRIDMFESVRRMDEINRLLEELLADVDHDGVKPKKKLEKFELQ